MSQHTDSKSSGRKRLPTGAILGMIIGCVSAVIALTVVFTTSKRNTVKSTSHGVLQVELDTSHSFLILVTEKASTSYIDVLAEAQALHPEAPVETFSPNDLSTAEALLKKYEPYYVQLFLMPEELDVNFGWRWLTMSSGLDDDPFVDTRTGFITGAAPEDAARLIARISRAVVGEISLPAKMIDNLGPNPQAGADVFNVFPGSYFVPALGSAMGLQGISHGSGGYKNEWLNAMDGAGVIHLGGHGHPDRIDAGLTASQAGQAELDPCVVFSGVCYTGVCGRSYDMFGSGGRVVEQMSNPNESFCLQLLTNNVIGYLAALHPDHGIPIYQEMEYMAWRGATLGDVMKYTYDGIVLGNGGVLPEFEILTDGMNSPQWTPAEIMLKGTGSRILFGDPSLRILTPIDETPPIDITTERKGSVLIVGAIMSNTEYKAIFTDTFHDYLAFKQNMFNDRVLVSVELPENYPTPSTVRVLGAANGSKTIRHRLQGWGVEEDGGKRFVQVQVDLASTGYMQSEWRNRGAAVGIEIRP